MNFEKKTNHLDMQVQYLKGVGPAIADRLAQKRIHTIRDLMYFIPRQYRYRRGLTAIKDLVNGHEVKIKGIVEAFKRVRTRRRRTFVEMKIVDDSGHITVRWFNFFKNAFDNVQKGQEVILAGKVSEYKGKRQMVHPEFEPVNQDEQQDIDEEIVPIYGEIEGIPARKLRNIVRTGLPLLTSLQEPLEPSLLKKFRLPTLQATLQNLHIPAQDAVLAKLNEFQSPWHQRLVFDELLALQVGIAIRRHNTSSNPGVPIPLKQSESLNKALQILPFELTSGQKKVLLEIEKDICLAKPMNRLIQGDVGSGKTAVAFVAAAVAMDQGYQAAIMAPTELLAEQHFKKAKEIFGADFPVSFLLGGQKAAIRRNRLADIAVGRSRLVIGTHALIQEGVQFKKLALVIIDEQHRFGVMQRARLIQKGHGGKVMPHVLVMTATPIPRTLAMTVYGDLDVSVIDGLPPGRKPIETTVFKEEERLKMYALMRQELKKGHQVYMVYPLVQESEAEIMMEIKDATSMAEHLQQDIFPDIHIGLMHGRMSSDEKQEVMHDFRAGKINILVATTVIEVGIDVPNATVIVVEHAERFGLSQLHQLRGRIGRGFAGGQCFLMVAKQLSQDSFKRVKVMEQYSNGFKIAEADLSMRGPGDLIGTRQSGLPTLAFANLVRDQRIMFAAREEAKRIIESDPLLEQRPLLKDMVLKQWEGRLALAKVG